ncbi:MAG: Mrp/NBP35 family ATP-binding protein [Pseudomonadota bacterium]
MMIKFWNRKHKKKEYDDQAIEQQVRNILEELTLVQRIDPKPEIQYFACKQSRVRVVVQVADSQISLMESFKNDAIKRIESLSDVEKADIALTSHSGQKEIGQTSSSQNTKIPPQNKPQNRPQAQSTKQSTLLFDDIPYVIAVASGKGGVGKSTTAINLGIAFSQIGLNVGLLDADIYGPSLPKLLGTDARPQKGRAGKVRPIEAWGLVAMSIGFLIDEKTAMIWRGPMVQGALRQMISEVEWGALDLVIIDLPPGTGDIQLSLAQQLNLSGVVVVSTPQDIALSDVRKALTMFNQVQIPVLGMIENMSFFHCSECGARTDIFGHGGAKSEALEQNIAFLGEIPLQTTIRETSDQGTPITADQPEHKVSKIYYAIASDLLGKMEKEKTNGDIAPQININP